jgi:general secretion pathway protein F
MRTYECSVIDREGRTRRRRLTAADVDALRALLQSQGLLLSTIHAVSRTGSEAAAQGGGPALSAKSLALITRQLSTLASVAPLEEALRTLAEQTADIRSRRVLALTHAGVLEGLRLSDAMTRSGRAFPATYRAMVSAGEASGSLPVILERLADLLEAQQEIRSKITTALVYPIVLAVVAMAVITALMTFVVPRVVDQFNVSGQELPGLTLAIIGLSRFLVDWGWLLAIVIILTIVTGAWALSRPAIRLKADGIALSLPLIGPLLRQVEAAHLSRSLATMIASGLPVLEALELAGRANGNAVLRQAAAQMATSVREGSGLSAAMKRTGVFPPLLVYLTASGETSGRLEAMLERAADYLEREFRTATAVGLSLLEPAIIVIMGGVVCLVILSILLPILQINTLGAV